MKGIDTMSDLIVSVGSVTDDQYQRVYLDLIQRKLEPQILRLTEKEWLFNDDNFGNDVHYIIDAEIACNIIGARPVSLTFGPTLWMSEAELKPFVDANRAILAQYFAMYGDGRDGNGRFIAANKGNYNSVSSVDQAKKKLLELRLPRIKNGKDKVRAVILTESIWLTEDVHETKLSQLFFPDHHFSYYVIRPNGQLEIC